MRRLHFKDEAVRKFTFPGVAMDGADVISIAILQPFDFLHTAPPLRPVLRMENQIPDFFLRGFEAPDGDEFVIGHFLECADLSTPARLPRRRPRLSALWSAA